MEREVRKIYEGMAELRDYDVQKCIDAGESMRVKYDGDFMILSLQDLANKCINVSKLMKSTNGKKDYHLFGYKWEPVEMDY